jgi:hypothetical protein
MLHQTNLLKLLARAAAVRMPEDLRALLARQTAFLRDEESRQQRSGQELAGTGALVFEGEAIENPSIH